MRTTLIAVGRNRSGPLNDSFDLYAKRMAKAKRLGPLVLREVEEKRTLSSDELKQREAELLLNAVPQGARLVVLDERGKALGSEKLAEKLGTWRDEGTRDLAIIIGGADGLHSSVRQNADLVLALSPLTWPHMLVRVLIAEQIYRADCILSGHPYHRT